MTTEPTNPTPDAVDTAVPAAIAPEDVYGAGPGDNSSRDTRAGRGATGGRGPRRDRPERAKSEFDQKTISVRRVTRVMAGGRRFNFSVALVAGDRKGRVGVGLGKAGDTAAAIDKALRDAKKHMIKIPMTKSGSIAHDVAAKCASSTIIIRPAAGKGLVAGASVRIVLELGGVKDVTAKVLSRSHNSLSNARAAIDALSKLR
jgi:small subunit ribosomal protein S5